VQTPPRPKSDSGFESGPDGYWIATKMYWIHCLVGISLFTKYRKNQPETVWEMLINLLQSPIRQWWEMEKGSRIRIWDRITTSSFRGFTTMHYIYRLFTYLQKLITCKFWRVITCPCLPCLIDVCYYDRELSCTVRQTEWPITLLRQLWRNN